MTKRTKKVGSTGRFGARYGIKIRRQILEIEKLPKIYSCPNCSSISLERVSSGIWKCKKCNAIYASNAYYFSAPKAIHKEIEVKGAVPKAEEEKSSERVS